MGRFNLFFRKRKPTIPNVIFAKNSSRLEEIPNFKQKQKNHRKKHEKSGRGSRRFSMVLQVTSFQITK